MAHGQKGGAVDRGKRLVVILAFGHYAYLTGGCGDAEDRSHAIFGSDEVDRLRVGIPCDRVGGVVPVDGEIGLFACGEIEREYAVFVRFIPVMFHAEPCEGRAVGAECRLCVVSFHPICEIGRGAVVKIVEIEVGVGREGILHAGLLARHIDEFLAVGTPCEGFDAAERFHRSFIRFIGHYVGHVGQPVAVKFADKRMGHFRNPFIPVLVHQIVDDAACGHRQIRICILGCAGIFHVGYQYHVLAVGGEKKSAYAALYRAYGLAAAAIGVHHPQLGLAVDRAYKRYALAAVDPHGAVLRAGSGGQALGFAAVCVHDIEIQIALVLFYALVAYAIEHFGAVGRYTWSRYTAECLKHFAGVGAVDRLEIRLVDHISAVGRRILTAACQKC